MPESETKNFRIAIFGASSQVGSSVAFYLKHYTPHEPVCYIRSGYSAIFFEISDIKIIVSDIDNLQLLKDNLKEIDVVLDFTYPAAQTFEIAKFIKTTTQTIISVLPNNAIYIYMSSIMAYGMPNSRKQLKPFMIARESYGLIKRSAENIVKSIGAKYKVQVYNFRLGQVHGFLQSVSESFREKLTSVSTAYLDGKETDTTNTIFISSLCEAIIKIGNEKPKQHTYTLVSYPQWPLHELYKFYLDFFSINTSIIYQPKEIENPISFKKIILTKIKRHRPLIEAHFLKKLPKTYVSIKGKYRILEMQNEIRNKKVNYLDFNLLGVPTLPIIKNLNSSYKTVLEHERLMQQLYLTFIAQHTK